MVGKAGQVSVRAGGRGGATHATAVKEGAGWLGLGVWWGSPLWVTGQTMTARRARPKKTNDSPDFLASGVSRCGASAPLLCRRPTSASSSHRRLPSHLGPTQSTSQHDGSGKITLSAPSRPLGERPKNADLPPPPLPQSLSPTRLPPPVAISYLHPPTHQLAAVGRQS